MRKALIFVVAICCVSCDGNSLSARDAGALGGGAVGAGLGAIIGHATGSSGAGIAIGAAAGALTGGLIGNQFDSQNAKNDERTRQLDDQQRQIQENARLLDELKRAGTDVRASERGVVVNFPDVLFEVNSAKLTPEARNASREIAHALNRVPTRTVAVEGHTDALGTVEFNQRLSEQRARSVADELAGNGVPRRRLVVVGKGEGQPIASNKTAAGRQRNRRVEVVIENS